MRLDLHQHAVLEASAGTGKTHSIGELVLRLLTEEGVPLEKILIVTFTEKATGELKSRLRLALEKEASREGPHRELLRSAGDGFDQAWIFTLHGFCRRVLQEFPLEQDPDAGSQLVHDADLLEPCLREIQRRTWRQEHGSRLGEVLQMSGYQRQFAAVWEQQVRELAEKTLPGGDTRVEPAAIAGWPELLANLQTALEDAVSRLRPLVQQLEGTSTGEFMRAFSIIKKWLDQQDANSKEHGGLIRSFHDLVCDLRKRPDFCRGGFLALSGRKTLAESDEPAAQARDSLWPGSQILTLLERIYRSADWPAFRHQLMVRTVPQLQQALDAHKRQHGLWSFHDMIARVDEALDPEQNPRADRLAAMLRQRFRCGIVDEFQDTDPIQWRILQRIFLPAVAAVTPSLPLFLVGDPKQAIFGFRGADLPTYLRATRELQERYRAQDAPLRTNWRSTPELIGALNRLFEVGEWFPKEGGIRYLPVEAAPAADRPSQLLADRTGRPALTVVDWRQDLYLSKLRRRHAEFIVREIGRLLDGSEAGPTMVSTHRGMPRPLRAGDICVLVLRRREARPLLEALRKAGIPYSFYKQPALWKSQEAVHLRFLLEALCQPDHTAAFRKALLTRFFRIPPQTLAQGDEFPSNHPARQLFEQWLELAQRRQWASLFQSTLEDTGLFFADDTDVDRRRANYRHLTSRLTQQAYRQNLDLISLTEWFRGQEGMGVVDEDVQPKETERPRVQIMTVHASKGLEFPIVFLAGGWTQKQLENTLVYRTAEQVQVFDVSNPPQGSAARLAAERDRLDEDRRLLYVALTRAMFKLYVPFTLPDGTYWKQRGPIPQLLAPALQRAGLDRVDPAWAAIIDPAEPAPAPGGARKPADADGDNKAAHDSWCIKGPLLPSVDVALSRPGLVIRSFTSLHRASKAAEEAAFAEEGPAADEQTPGSTDETAQADPLRGTVFGEIVHKVLEQIDYAEVGQASSPTLLLAEGSAAEKVLGGVIEHFLPQLAATIHPQQPDKLHSHEPEARVEELESLCRRRVAELVWHALHTPLPELGPLCKVPAKDRLVELSFLFPQQESGSARAGTRHSVDSYLTGYIDLVFRQNGRYFLVDWKTNALAGYGAAEVARAMDDGDYHLQYRLYLQALVRWLSRCLGSSFDWRRDLGGVYYLFLRGLGGAAGDGVFFHRPTVEDFSKA